MSAGEIVKMALDLSVLAEMVPPGAPASPPGVVLSGSPPADLHADFATECLPILSSAFDDRHWNQQAVMDAVLTPSTCRWVITARAAEDGKLVGIATIHSVPDPSVAKLHWVGVDTGWRGGGVGRALVVMACQKAIELDARTVFLQTEAFRVSAISLYTSLGFRPVGPVDDPAVPPRSTDPVRPRVSGHTRTLS